MFVTIRAFRNYGEMVPAGLIVVPDQIRRFKDKLREGKIVEVTEAKKPFYERYLSRILAKPFTFEEAGFYVRAFDGLAAGVTEQTNDVEPEKPAEVEPEKPADIEPVVKKEVTPAKAVVARAKAVEKEVK